MECVADSSTAASPFDLNSDSRNRLYAARYTGGCVGTLMEAIDIIVLVITTCSLLYCPGHHGVAEEDEGI